MTFAEFINQLRNLEIYAKEYINLANEDEKELVLNYIRTGVERYSDGAWNIIAGAPKTGFINFVSEREQETGNPASGLRDLNNFIIPNGQEVEFEHMFGTMNIGYLNNQSLTSADFSGWAGDLVDLFAFSAPRVTETELEPLTEEIRTTLLGVDHETEHSFGILDIYGDLDAYYLLRQYRNSESTLADIMTAYFSTSLTDKDRAVYFIINRFPNKLTREEVRSAIFTTYKQNTGVISLEAERNLDSNSIVREATAYAFADYLYFLAKDVLAEMEYTEEPDEPEPPQVDDTYEIYKRELSTFAPGVEHEVSYVLTPEKYQSVYYLTTVDTTRDDVQIYANYYNNEGTKWAFSRMTDQIAAAVAKHTDPSKPEYYVENYKPVAGINGDFYNMTSGKPAGPLVMEGIAYQSNVSSSFFAILDDGTPVIGTAADYQRLQGRIVEAIGGGQIFLKDGEIKAGLEPLEKRDSSRAPRTSVGITADNKVIMMVSDGRQKPYSAGASIGELAKMMKHYGAVIALNLDGGGSTSMVGKREGEDHLSVLSSPSDGYERSVASSLFVVSTAETTNEFSYAVIEAESDYLTVGTGISLTKTGVSSSGNSAEIPAEAVWQISNPEIGRIENDTFYAEANGETEIQLLYKGEVAGRRKITVTQPDFLRFSEKRVSQIFGQPFSLPLVATYRGNRVKLNGDDLLMQVINATNAGTFDGLTFVTAEGFKTREITIEAGLVSNPVLKDRLEVIFYEEDETMYDFSSANGGNSMISWTRNVPNGRFEIAQNDLQQYNIIDVNKPMEINYTYAIEMKEIPIPEDLKPMMELIPGGDNVSLKAWDFLLQLAERVHPATNVKAVMDFDDNVHVDVSELQLVNDLFELTDCTVDEETSTVTMTINFIDQTEMVPPGSVSSLVIIKGVKLTPKDGAAWDARDQLTLVESGEIDYTIYLRSSTLYGMALSQDIQNKYHLFPYELPKPDGKPGEMEQGGYFSNHFVSIRDSYILDRSSLEGWQIVDNRLYYYQNNQKTTGLAKVPGYQDEANEYYYVFDQNGVSQGKVNGIIDLDGNKYYAINGKFYDGWRTIRHPNGTIDYYYFDPTTKAALNGKQVINGNEFIFENYVLIRGALLGSGSHQRYYWGSFYYSNQWFELDGKTYHAKRDTYLATGLVRVISPDGLYFNSFLFDENAVWLGDYNGIYTDSQNDTYLIKNGEMVSYAGLVKIDDNYYYFTNRNVAVKDSVYYVSKNNNLLPKGNYLFDFQGRLVKAIPDKNGIYEEDGSLFYYKDNVRYYAGLFKEGEYYYYAKPTGELVRSGIYFTTKNNGLLPPDNYVFDHLGRLIKDASVVPDPPEEPDDPIDSSNSAISEGIVEIEGKKYYYKDGYPYYAGLIKINDDYYYVRSDFTLVTNSDYTITKHNNLLPVKTYSFDADGKILPNPPEFIYVKATSNVRNRLNQIVGERCKGEALVASRSLDGNYYEFKENGAERKIHYTRVSLTEVSGNAYIYEQSNVRSVDTGEIIAKLKIGDTVTGIMKPDGWFYFTYQGKAAKIWGSLLIYQPVRSYYVKATSNVRDQAGEVADQKLKGELIRGVDLIKVPYVRFVDKGKIRIIHKSRLTTNEIAERVYIYEQSNIRSVATEKVIGKLSIGDAIIGVMKPDGWFYFNYQGKPAKVWGDLVVYNPVRTYYVKGTSNIRDQALKIADTKRKGELIQGVDLANVPYIRFEENGTVRIVHRSVLTTAETEGKAYVNARTNVRSQAAGNIIGNLQKGDVVIGVQKPDGWIYFTYKGQAAKIYAGLLSYAR